MIGGNYHFLTGTFPLQSSVRLYPLVLASAVKGTSSSELEPSERSDSSSEEMTSVMLRVVCNYALAYGLPMISPPPPP